MSKIESEQKRMSKVNVADNLPSKKETDAGTIPEEVMFTRSEVARGEKEHGGEFPEIEKECVDD